MGDHTHSELKAKITVRKERVAIHNKAIKELEKEIKHYENLLENIGNITIFEMDKK